MGFSQQDLAEQQGRLIDLDKIRFGARSVPRPPIHIPGLPDLDKPKRPVKERKPSPEPGYERFQQRLW